MTSSPTPVVEGALIAEMSRYTWRPRAVLRSELPHGFRIEMDCMTARDGSRRFTPAGGVEAFLIKASLGGLALLSEDKGLDAEWRSSYHAMRLIFQRAPLLREHLARSFKRESDLVVAGAERAGRGRKDILPERIGLDPGGRGRRWTVAELIRHGRAHAVAAGDPNPDPARCIASGLFVAARLDPLDPARVTQAEGLGLVRMALFDLGPAAKVTEAVRQVVNRRLLDLIEPLLGVDAATFNRRFFAGRNNLVHRIAKQKKVGGPVARDVVRRALLDLGFDALTYVGDCVCLQMQAFLQALPSPLDERDRAWFAALYFKQVHLGGLPLILLRDRFAFLKEAILDILAAPGEPGPVGVLLRLLQYYEEMTTARRAVDRGLKRRDIHNRATGKVARTLPVDDEMSGPSTAGGNDFFQEIVAQLVEDRGIHCPCPEGGAWKGRLRDNKTGGEMLIIDIECEKGVHSERIEVTRGEFKEIGQELGGIGA